MTSSFFILFFCFLPKLIVIHHYSVVIYFVLEVSLISLSSFTLMSSSRSTWYPWNLLLSLTLKSSSTCSWRRHHNHFGVVLYLFLVTAPIFLFSSLCCHPLYVLGDDPHLVVVLTLLSSSMCSWWRPPSCCCPSFWCHPLLVLGDDTPSCCCPHFGVVRYVFLVTNPILLLSFTLVSSSTCSWWRSPSCCCPSLWCSPLLVLGDDTPILLLSFTLV